MKKFLLMMVAVLATSFTSLNAQHVYSNTVIDGWSLGINGGVLAPQQHAFDLANHTVLKNYRASWGVELGKTLTTVTSFSLSDELHINTSNSTTVFDTNVLLGNLHWNITNLLLGYYGEPQKFEIEVIPSVGWLHHYDGTAEVEHDNHPIFRGAIGLNYNFGNAKQWQINVRPSMTYVDHFRANSGIFALNAGITYKFRGGASKSHNFVLCDAVYTLEEYDELREESEAKTRQINALTEALNNCEKNRTEAVNTLKAIENTPIVDDVCNDTLGWFVFFDKNSACVTKEMRPQVEVIADYLKANPNLKINVVGYADKATGSKEVNQKVSELRAKSVVEMLKGYGIDETRLTAVGKGDSEQPFKTNDANRVVLSIIK